MIELKNVNKQFKNKILFKNLNYVFENGKTYHIKGENGSGKSVLLKLICGFSLCDSGCIVIDGKIINKDIDFINNAGISINNENFITYLNGYDNLKLLLDIQKKVSMDEINRYASLFYMEDEIKKVPYKLYSQGMKQKLRLIQAFIENPQYIIIDEPTNALDEKSIKVLYDLIKESKKDMNKIIIFITHNDEIINDLADVHLLIKDYHLKEIDNHI